jgi:aerobic-type carbon monoxide dehydrogenase small subunit (CoxS/CutS family)
MKDISRRKFLRRAGAGLASAPVVARLGRDGAEAAQAQPPSGSADDRHEIRMVVNGTDRRVRIEDRWTLADVLRDHLDLTGTKVGCDRGECGACTVIVNGTALYSCSFLAAWADGSTVLTVEGLAKSGALDPLQQAFIDHDAPQCGFCTSGQLMSARALLNRVPHPTEDEVKHALAGNLCRCSNYNRYVEAVLAAAGPAPAPARRARAAAADTAPTTGGR